MEFEILVEGGPRVLEIAVNYRPGNRMLADEYVKAWIEEAWQKALAAARGRSVPLYDGKLFRLESFRVEGKKLIVDLGDTGYKEYVGTRLPDFFRSRKREVLANPLAVCAAVVTADGKILVEQRRGLDVYSGRYHVIGGFLERDKDSRGGPHPAKAMCREVREETGLSLELDRFSCLGLVYDLATPHPELCFVAGADDTFAEVSRQTGKDGEIERLEYVEDSSQSLRDFIVGNHGNISNTGEACLLLYGLRRFGRRWYDGVLVEIA